MGVGAEAEAKGGGGGVVRRHGVFTPISISIRIPFKLFEDQEPFFIFTRGNWIT